MPPARSLLYSLQTGGRVLRLGFWLVIAALLNTSFGSSQRPLGYVKVKYQELARNHRPPGDAVRTIQSMDGAKARKHVLIMARTQARLLMRP